VSRCFEEAVFAFAGCLLRSKDGPPDDLVLAAAEVPNDLVVACKSSRNTEKRAKAH